MEHGPEGSGPKGHDWLWKSVKSSWNFSYINSKCVIKKQKCVCNIRSDLIVRAAGVDIGRKNCQIMKIQIFIAGKVLRMNMRLKEPNNITNSQ